MKLIIASNNSHKVYEIKQILKDRFDEILSLREAGVNHETVEDGATFAENAMKKAREIAEITGCAALADDSGLCVNALGGAPGIYSARYAGEHGNDAKNRALLLENMKDKEDRTANFTCALALVMPDGTAITVEGKTYGKILHEETGEGGFGYDSLFYSDDLQKSFGVATAEEKNSVSHRFRALQNLREVCKHLL